MQKANSRELTETVKDMLYSTNIEFAVKSEPVYSLIGTLSAKNVTALRKLCKLHGVAGCSKMDKNSCITVLKDKITNVKALSEILLMLSPQEWELFKKAVKTEQVTDDTLLAARYEFMLSLGIMNIYYYGAHFIYVVPAEIKKVYTSIEKSGFPAEKEHGDLLNAYAIAAVNLYGVISQDDFVKLFNGQNNRKTNTDEVFGTLIKFVAMNYGYCFWDEYIVNDSFQGNDYKDVGR